MTYASEQVTRWNESRAHDYRVFSSLVLRQPIDTPGLSLEIRLGRTDQPSSELFVYCERVSALALHQHWSNLVMTPLLIEAVDFGDERAFAVRDYEGEILSFYCAPVAWEFTEPAPHKPRTSGGAPST